MPTYYRRLSYLGDAEGPGEFRFQFKLCEGANESGGITRVIGGQLEGSEASAGPRRPPRVTTASGGRGRNKPKTFSVTSGQAPGHATAVIPRRDHTYQH